MKEQIQERINYLNNIDYDEYYLRCSEYCLDCNEAVVDHISYDPNDYTDERLKDHNPEQKQHALKEQQFELKWLNYAKEKGIKITSSTVKDGSQHASNKLHDDHTTFHFCAEGGSLKELSDIFVWMLERIK